MKLGEKIKQLRIAAELTQPELAAKANIEQSYLSKLENEKGSPSYDVISKVAAALELSGLELINSLSPSYVKESLSHIPEVAEQAAERRYQQKQAMKNGYIKAAFVIIFGIALTVLGGSQAMFPERSYEYISRGVVLPGEPIRQFEGDNLHEIAETDSERRARLRANKARLDEIIIIEQENKGRYFVEPVTGGKRVFYQRGSITNRASGNMYFIVFGIILIVSGGFMMNFAFQFKKD